MARCGRRTDAVSSAERASKKRVGDIASRLWENDVSAGCGTSAFRSGNPCLCGGFPCQTFSKAGKRSGFQIIENENGDTDDRGQLFFRIIDILNDHPECNYVILENVRNLADNEENWRVVCNELKALGFIITENPIIESPHHFGIPQVRERVYILGIKETAIKTEALRENKRITRHMLGLDKHFEACPKNCIPMLLDAVTDPKYYVPDDLAEVLDIWEEFLQNIKGIKSPFWLHKAGLGIYDDEKYKLDPEIGYYDMPDWKKELVWKSRVIAAYGETGANNIVQNIVETYKSIQLQLADPNKNNNVLLVGKVQSGKTSNLEMLTALAFDNGYNILVIYGGYDTSLLKQTTDRFKETFGVVGDVTYDDEGPAIFTTDDSNQILSIDDEIMTDLLENNKPVIFVSMKRPVAMRKINALFGRLDKSKFKAFIIDDEGDQASLNTAKDKIKNASATYF